MNDKQRQILEKLMGLPVGTILRNGKTERILCGFMPGMIVLDAFRAISLASPRERAEVAYITLSSVKE
ncbi:hypothetical protein [Paenibacillus odorifer]|uniref:Uncharacterized protein n=1 Tax=Paenibacillus odorifer TaxID=189426 RepID=A0AAD0KLN4_9BACL|nr:hypothetical protein [Paenibacillus odorifer]AWV35182.1 hypothetical protein CD191_22495 [Paenibacillus odorifer]